MSTITLQFTLTDNELPQFQQLIALGIARAEQMGDAEDGALGRRLLFDIASQALDQRLRPPSRRSTTTPR